LEGERWVACKPGFFPPVRVLSRPFRRLFLEGLTALHVDPPILSGAIRSRPSASCEPW
jgi:hypothetical protein